MSQLFWGVDGRTHRLGPDGMALCKTPIDNSRPPEAAGRLRLLGLRHPAARPRHLGRRRGRSGQAPRVRTLFPMLLLAFAVVAVIWAITRF